MQQRLLTAVLAGAFLLAGCQSAPQKSPYEYRFAKAAGQELCLQTEPAGEVSLALMIRTALEQKGFSVRNVTDFDDADCRQCVRFTARMEEWSNHRIRSATLEYFSGHSSRPLSVSTRDDEGTVGHVFGSPADDQSIIIWSLVDRLFPDPMPWRDE